MRLLLLLSADVENEVDKNSVPHFALYLLIALRNGAVFWIVMMTL